MHRWPHLQSLGLNGVPPDFASGFTMRHVWPMYIDFWAVPTVDTVNHTSSSVWRERVLEVEQLLSNGLVGVEHARGVQYLLNALH